MRVWFAFTVSEPVRRSERTGFKVENQRTAAEELSEKDSPLAQRRSLTTEKHSGN